MFGRRFFGGRYWGPRFFGDGSDTEAVVIVPPIPAFNSGFRIVEHGIAQGALIVISVSLIPGVASGEQVGVTFIPGTATGEVGEELMLIIAEAA